MRRSLCQSGRMPRQHVDHYVGIEQGAHGSSAVPFFTRRCDVFIYVDIFGPRANRRVTGDALCKSRLKLRLLLSLHKPQHGLHGLLKPPGRLPVQGLKLAINLQGDAVHDENLPVPGLDCKLANYRQAPPGLP